MKDPSPHTRTLDVSVIVTVYRQPDTLRLTLQSLTQQQTEARYEIIVTDDGSDPSIAGIVNEYASSATLPIRYIWQQDCHFRAGQARNNAIKMANGKLLILLDGDCVPPLNLVACHLGLHRHEERLILGGGRLFCDIDNFHKDCGIEDVPFEKASEWLLSHCEVNEQEEGYRSKWLESANPWKAGFAYNMSVRASSDFYFDENFIGWGIEDWEVFYRLWKNGYNFSYQPDTARVWHFDIPGVIGNVFKLSDHDGMVKFAINALYFIDKYPEDSSLRECTIAFRCYELDPVTNRWFWDATKNYSVEDGIRRLREWLARN